MRRSLFALSLSVFAAASSLFGSPAAAQSAVTYTGVNLAGADFGESSLPGTYGSDYTYPTRAEVDYFVAEGMNTFRLPFRWERLQRTLNGSFDSAELARLDDFVTYATGRGAYVVLDPHNYARYNGQIIGQGVSVDAFKDFWGRLAARYKTNGRVIFGLMNEPKEMPTELWRDDANAAIAAIRAAGATNLILVPGNAWTGAHSWYQSWYGTPNATVMLSITDPANNYAFEVHQYLDGNYSGTSDQCVSATIGSEKLVEFTNWLRQHNKRGFLGEFGGGRNSTCHAALDNMLDYVDSNSDVWLGWTYWAAGPWWGDYIFTIEPTNCPGACTDRPQMAYLAPHFAGAAPPPQPTPTPTPTPSPTPSPTPPPQSGALKLQYRAADTNAGDNQIKPHFRIVNAGAAAVPLSELKIRYWFTGDGGQAINHYCDWAQVGCGRISARVVTLATPVNGADRYLELSFNAAAGSLAGGGGTTGEIQIRLAKTDWSNFNEANDYSFDPTKTSFADWTRVTLYRNGTLVWGAGP